MSRITELRRAVGLTQEELAYRARVSLRTVARWEIGRAHPRKRNARALAKALGVDIDALLLGPAEEADR